jgi:hypothetical protein
MSRADYAQEVHRYAFKPKTTRKVISHGIDEIFACDHMGPWPNAKDNDGYAYLFVVIDLFSRYCWVIPQKDLSAKTTWAAFDSILKSGRSPQKLWTDGGSSFLNVFAKNCAAKGIELYKTYGTHKVAVVERLNRTIGEAVYKKLTELNSKQWIDVLPSVVAAYNSKKHSSTGMTPIEASKKKNEETLFQKQYGKALIWSPVAAKFREGDWVRVSREKGAFEKGRLVRWTTEIYRVSKVLKTMPTTYKLADAFGDVLEGSFYDNDIQKSIFNPESQKELLFPRRKAGPNEVDAVISYRILPGNKTKFGKYMLTVRYGDGGTEERPLSNFVGKEVKGKFVPTSRNPDQIMRPIDEWAARELPDVLKLL